LSTPRQTGGALAVAAYGGLVADPARFQAGMRASLLSSAVLLLACAAGAAALLPGRDRSPAPAAAAPAPPG
ncbi:hypothetical protein ACFW1A_29440, partial [Kitasatospora sp. NPDC058965]